MRTVPGRRIAAVLFVVALAVTAAWLGRLLSTKGVPWAVNFSTVAAFVVGALGLVLPLLKWAMGSLFGPTPAARVDVRRLRDDLAAALSRQWMAEERLRQINDPRPLPVSWAVTATALEAMPGTCNGDRSELEAGLAGEYDEILTVFNRVSSHRLIILGGPGAGKSVLAIRLALDLLGVREPGMPVPVIVSAATWDPDIPLLEWVADQLSRGHPGLTAPVKTITGETTSLAYLIAADGVLPIIDGLDELPEPQRAQALQQLNVAGSDIPLVVTSRQDEYLGAVGAAGRAISRAVVVELLPLRVLQVKAYLGEATTTGLADRWRAVFDHLDAEPDGPLTRVLSIPLMIWLTRKIYDSRGGDPAELIDGARFGKQEVIEYYLLDAFVPAVYANSTSSRLRRGFQCTPQQALRWLSFLAAHLRRIGSADITWWRLTRAAWVWRPVSLAVRSVLLSGLAWFLVIWVLSQYGNWRHGAYVHHTSIVRMLLGGPFGRLATPTVQQVINSVQAGLRHWLHIEALELSSPGGGPPWQPFAGIFPWHSFLAFEVAVALFAVAAGILIVIMEPGILRGGESAARQYQHAGSVEPVVLRIHFLHMARVMAGRILARGLLACLAVAAVLTLFVSAQGRTASVAGLFGQHQVWEVILLVSLFGVAAVPESFRSPLGISRSVSAAEALRLDRQAEIVVTVLEKGSFAILVWLWAGSKISLAYVVFATASTTIRIFLGGVEGAYVRYVDARVGLAGSGRLPWRLMSFLTDARTRGVLRQTGSAYQFRHLRLQHRLAAQCPPWSARSAALTERMLGEQRSGRVLDLIGHIKDPKTSRRPGWQTIGHGLGFAYTHHDERFQAEASNTTRTSIDIDDPCDLPAIVTRLHPSKLLGATMWLLAGLASAGLLSQTIARGNGIALVTIWCVWLLGVAYLIYRFEEWRKSYFIMTNKRIILVTGIIHRNIMEVPLVKLADISCRRSVWGTLNGYGQLIINSTDKQAPMRSIDYIPYPEEIYREACDLLFAQHE